MLLYFSDPIVTSLRGMQQASELGKVQRKLGCPRSSLDSLSEAARVLDADLLAGIAGELIEQLPNVAGDEALDTVRGIITLVDGTVLSALFKLVQAMWSESKGEHGIKLHTHFERLKGVPVRMDLTDGDGNERAVLQEHVQPDRVYVLDRGYAKFQLFADDLRVKSSLVCRVRDNSVYEIVQGRATSPEAKVGEVRRDPIVRFTGDQAVNAGMDQPLRLVELRPTPRMRRFLPSATDSCT